MKSLNLFPTVLLFFVFSSINSSAQVNVGLKSGVNIPSIHVDQNDVMMNGFNSIVSLHIGAYSDVFLSEKISLLIELLYSVKGGQTITDFGLGSTSIKITSHLKYLSVPVLFNYHFKNISFEIGPEFSYKVSSKTIFDENEFDGDFGDTKFDVGIDFGIKHHLKRLNLGVRYSRGFNNFSDVIFTDINGDPVNNQPKLFNKMVQVSVGFDLLQKKSSKKEDE